MAKAKAKAKAGKSAVRSEEETTGVEVVLYVPVDAGPPVGHCAIFARANMGSHSATARGMERVRAGLVASCARLGGGRAVSSVDDALLWVAEQVVAGLPEEKGLGES